MRMDKLTHSLQAALGEAQSIALGRDHPFIEPAHVLRAMLDAAGSPAKHLLRAAGAQYEQLDTALARVQEMRREIGEHPVESDHRYALSMQDWFDMRNSLTVAEAIVPILAIVTIVRGLKADWERHKKVAKITFPIWLYVSITGVVIYFMLYHLPVETS